MRRILSFFRSGRIPMGVAAAAGIVAVGGGVAIGALTANSSSPAATPAAATAPTTTPPATAPAAGSAGSAGSAVPAAGKKTGNHHVLRGTVTAVSASTWTLQTDAGQTLSVEVTSQTRLGKALEAGPPAVGTRIVVVYSGADPTATATAGTSITALRIGLGRPAGTAGGGTSVPAPPTTTPTSTPTGGSAG
ncbi:MAG: hypothetical protein KGQ66_23400 [Acidobacteriota bacterium]|nr:hypothetical protein [Acidobacteriota bacterium]